MLKYSQKTIQNIKSLRKNGRSIPEIERLTGVPRATIWRYTKDLKLEEKALNRIKNRRGINKERALQRRRTAKQALDHIFGGEISAREKFALLLGIYWGEGTKRELSLINSDPFIVKAFVDMLRDLGVDEQRFLVTIRLHDSVNKKSAEDFWLSFLNLSKENIQNVYVIKPGSKSNLQYGMCRVRVKKNIHEFLLLMGGIEKVKKYLSP